MAVIEQDLVGLQSVVAPAPLLAISSTAANRLQAMMSEKQLVGYGLRVFVSGGGCSGLQYGMTFDDEQREGDTSWEAYGLKMMVDPISATYLTGASIDYQQDNMLAGAFKIDNPNAVSSCGCGHSFRGKSDQEAADNEGYDGGYAGGGCGHCGHG
ncbi:MAG TPA: iron-sulfur cluster assembly accessory protein [Kouleothrix sp.]|jgi:iron-sulfur cluster assembly accessory protein|nr:iron-sulfur cluster assembly accessory protein [Kouleothrix sp.]